MHAKSYITALQAYQPGLPIESVARQHGIQPEQIIKLASNENPLGASPKALEAIRVVMSGVHRYPEQYALIQALATKYAIDPASIVLGNGSNDVLDMIARVYLGPGDEAISSEYGFVMYQLATQATGAKNVVVPAATYGHDLTAMRHAITPATKAIWIANPNNPTGTYLPSNKLRQFISEVRNDIVIVLDEAYYEYLSPSDKMQTIAWIASWPNLVVVRTFSKIYGLAGLRIGYGIAAPAVVALCNRVRQPFSVNTLATAAATAALDDQDFVDASYTMNYEERELLLRRLQERGYECLPAYGNFVTFKTKHTTSLYDSLLKQGIIVRPLAGYNMPDWLRVTVGLPQENQHFLKALDRAIKQ